MLYEEEYIKVITRYLIHLADYTETISKLNLNDNSVISENLFARILNVVYGFELKNLNMLKQNAAVVDLYDQNSRVSVQVTSQKRSAKVKSCLEGFKSNNLAKDYDTLYIYILTTKAKGGYSTISDVSLGKFNFIAKNHVIDKSDLLKKLMDKGPTIQKEVLEILKSSIKSDDDEIVISNEEQTIINLIRLLSDNHKNAEFDKDSDIDPKKKIDKRFKSDAVIIENQYFELCIQYSPVLVAVEENNDVDSAKHSKIATYLRVKSSELLVKNNYDAMKSLEILTGDVTKLFEDAKLNYDSMAIRFFLLKNLTECNVFPILRGEPK